MFMTRRSHPVLGAALGGGLLVMALLGLVLGLGACSADSPSEPDQPQPSDPPPEASVWNITVDLNPSEVPAASDDPVAVQVRVRRRSNGQAPPNGTTVVLASTAGSFPSNVVQLNNGRGVGSFLPPDQPGTVTIQARLEGDVGQATLQVREAAVFFVGSVEPNSGSPNGGEEVVIRGGGFERPARVTFSGVPAQVLNVATNRIRIQTPPAPNDVPTGSTLQVPVTVTINLNEEEEQTDTLQNGFTYARGGSPTQPAVFSLNPSSGPNGGGTRVRIRGEGFRSPVQVFFGSGSSPSSFNGVEASVDSVTANEIVVTTPSATGFGQQNLNSTVDVLVRNVESGFATIASSAFSYGTPVLITAAGPTAGPYTGGTRVTIHGQGFDAPVAVSIDGIGQTVLSVTGTEIVIRTVGVNVGNCPSDGTIEADGFSVTNVESGDSAEADITFSYIVPTPVITGVSPNSGPESGNTPVSVQGLDFTDPVRVLFGDQAAPVESLAGDGTSIDVRTPTFSGDLEEEPCGNGGMRFVPTAVDVEVENLVTGCTDNFSNGFVYNPSDTTCRNEDMMEPGDPECSDGLDNDGDGLTDYNDGVSPPGDPECTSDGDDDESM